MFKIYDCDFGIKVNGLPYDFEHVNELQVEDPERNSLTRGANAKNKVGLPYKNGLKEPKKWTIPILDMSISLKGVLDSCYKLQTRVEVYCIDRKNGSTKFLNNAVLCNKPQQLAVNDTSDSMAVSLEFESFDSDEVYKE